MKKESRSGVDVEALDIKIRDLLDRALHPEDYDSDRSRRGIKLTAFRKAYVQAGEPLAHPRYRLNVRLEMLVALKQQETELMQAILADTEATEDARLNRQELEQLMKKEQP